MKKFQLRSCAKFVCVGARGAVDAKTIGQGMHTAVHCCNPPLSGSSSMIPYSIKLIECITHTNRAESGQ